MYQNDNDFVHSIVYTIDKRVSSESIRQKLYDLIIIHKDYINEQLFGDFLEVVRRFRQKYNDSRKFTNTFMLFTLTFLVEFKCMNLDFYVKRFPGSDQKFFLDVQSLKEAFPQIDGTCTFALVSSFDLFVFYHNIHKSQRSSSQPLQQQRVNRCSRSRERHVIQQHNQHNQQNQRRHRSRSNDSRNSRSNDNRGQDEEQKIILCIQQRDALIAQLNKEKDDLVRVIEMRNGFIRERDNIIHNQNAEIIRLRSFINGVQQRPAY